MSAYNLLTCFRIVLRMELQDTRTEVFREISDTNFVVGTVYRIYSRLPSYRLKALAVFLFGLKCVLEMRWPSTVKPEIFATGLYPNEVRALRHIQSLVPDLTIVHVTSSANPAHIIQATGNLTPIIKNSKRLFRLCTLLVRRYDFMPACRSYSVIVYFLAFRSHLMPARPKAALTASNYAPDAMGLAAVASYMGIPLIYVDHAFAPSGARYCPPVFADLSILTNELSAEHYRTRSQLQGQVVFLGVIGQTHPLRLDRLRSATTDIRVGIFLTGGVDNQSLRNRIQDLRNAFGRCHILVRPHPVDFFRHAVSGLGDRRSGVEVTRRTTITEDAQACDLVICGNTSGVLEVIKAGTPVFYWSKLDRLPEDYCGFVRHGLVPGSKDLAASLPEDVARFYRRDEWTGIVARYDPSYLVGPERIAQEIRAAVARLLTQPKPLSGS